MDEPTSYRLILASSSPARRDLLRRAGYQFDIQPAFIDEPTGAGFRDVRTYVHTVAWLKAAAVARQCADHADAPRPPPRRSAIAT